MTTNKGEWRKSSYSGGQNNNCVEVRLDAERTSVRDSKCPERAQIVVGRGVWLAFLTAVDETGTEH